MSEEKKESEVEIIHGMKDSMVYEGNAYLDAKGKIAEASVYWYEDDILCKCRPDMMCPPLKEPNSDNKIVIVDYKTTISCEPFAFNKSVKKYGYDMQAAWYRRGIQMAGYDVDDFVFIAQEKVHPYASKVFRITKEQMNFGWTMMESYLEDYKEFPNRKIQKGIAQPWSIASDYNKIRATQNLAKNHKELQTIAFLIIKNDSIWHESYFDGFDKNSKTNSFSMAKSIVTMALGKAIMQGKIKNLDQKVTDFFPELKGKFAHEVTVGDLSSMASGLRLKVSALGSTKTGIKSASKIANILAI